MDMRSKTNQQKNNKRTNNLRMEILAWQHISGKI